MDPLDIARRLAEQLKDDSEAALLAQEMVHALEERSSADQSPPQLEWIVGANPDLVKALQTLRKAAPTSAPVLLLGESGTGKELLARGLHDLSNRRDKPFVAFNCAAVPETLLESELFGHVRGAFTGAALDATGKFEAADGGTLFLDEIGEMSPGLQAKLLRTLQNGEIQPVGAAQPRQVDTRVVCATNQRLDNLVAEGKFREDLYYRLNVISIWLPALRDRREDLEALIEHFTVRDARELRKTFNGFDSPTKARLLAHDYPGNVRELRNVIRHAIVMADGPVAGLDDLPGYLRGVKPAVPSRERPRTAAELRKAKRDAVLEVERAFLIEALQRSGGSVTRAARETGVHRTRLSQLIRKYKIDPRRYRGPSSGA